MAPFAATLTCFSWMLACDAIVIQHGGESRSLDGGESQVARDADRGGRPIDAWGVDAECAGAEDGTACDDLDVCTPSSSCRGGVCVGGNSFDSCVVADVLAEFHEQQGVDGWFYGFWNASADTDGSYDADSDFTPMEYCGDGFWFPPGRCDTVEGEPGYQWTRVLDWALSHPETRPELELPIRRWVSDASGPARITLDHRVSGVHGDGTRALLLIDGVELWRNDAVAGDATGTQATFDIELRARAVVDQLVHPIGSSADDTTYFSMKIEGR